MRPLPGDDAFARPRPDDNDLCQHTGPQMTYVLADESTVDVSLEHASAILQRPTEPLKHHRSQHDIPDRDSGSSGSGGLSLSAGGAADKDKDKEQHVREVRPPSSRGLVEAVRHYDEDTNSCISRPESPMYTRPSGPSNPSQPMTPIMFGTPGPMSALSSVSSRRNSFSGSFSEDLANSHILSVDGHVDMDREQHPQPAMTNTLDSGSAPQLIMPSIKMPSRRPFTGTGKAMGRLKVLIAGDSGIGKTSLIKAIVQSCSHIVHVDPIAPSAVSLVLGTSQSGESPPRRLSRRSRSDAGTSQITEVYASTKPYPEWWSDLDDSRILKRRKSVEDAVLDRNICFVDTPGYSSASSAMETVSRVVTYVESNLHRMSSNSLADGDILNMVGGDGGVQVDVVFYMVSNRLKPVDMEYLRQLSPLTNLVLLLAQADLLTAEQTATRKSQIDAQLQEANIKPFIFTSSPHHHPYAISSALGSDHETMDASLLMSPDYVQPLVSTELAALVEQVFSADGTSWLRHAAARKYLQWRKGEATTSPITKPAELYNPLSFLREGGGTPTASQMLTPPPLTGGSFALAKVADHTQREERLAQIRLANWAGELQRSLAAERARYEGLARGERAVWLTERLNECVLDGTLVPVGKNNGSRRMGGRRYRRGSEASGRSGRMDPLGLLEVVADLRRKGVVVLEVLGSLGVLGGVVLWVCRQWPGMGGGPVGWAVGEWERVWEWVR